MLSAAELDRAVLESSSTNSTSTTSANTTTKNTPNSSAQSVVNGSTLDDKGAGLKSRLLPVPISSTTCYTPQIRLQDKLEKMGQEGICQDPQYSSTVDRLVQPVRHTSSSVAPSGHSLHLRPSSPPSHRDSEMKSDSQDTSAHSPLIVNRIARKNNTDLIASRSDLAASPSVKVSYQIDENNDKNGHPIYPEYQNEVSKEYPKTEGLRQRIRAETLNGGVNPVSPNRPYSKRSDEKSRLPPSSADFSGYSGAQISPSIAVPEESLSAIMIPVLVAVLPPALSFIFGGTFPIEELLLFVFSMFYLYHVLKQPWQLYMVMRSRRLQCSKLLGQGSSFQRGDTTLPPVLNDTTLNRQKAAYNQLYLQEKFLLLLVLLSPILGCGVLVLVRTYLVPFRGISKFNIVLFTIASGIRPLSHLIEIGRESADLLCNQIELPGSIRRVLEGQILELQKTVQLVHSSLSGQSDATAGFQHQLVSMQDQLRRIERRHERFEQVSQESIVHMEENLQLLYRHFNELLKATADNCKTKNEGCNFDNSDSSTELKGIPVRSTVAVSPILSSDAVMKRRPETDLVVGSASTGLLGRTLTTTYMLANIMFWPIRLISPMKRKKALS